MVTYSDSITKKMRTIIEDKHPVLPETGKVCSRFRNMKSQHLNDSHALVECVTKSGRRAGLTWIPYKGASRRDQQQDFVRTTI